MLSPDIIIPFDGAHASIPAGFVRDTRFDSKTVKAADSGFGDTGGNSTHIHTPSHAAHSFTGNGHAHNTGIIQNNDVVKSNAQHKDSPPYDINTSTHRHYSVGSGAMTSESINSATPSIGSASNDVSRYHYIFIKSTGYNFYPQNSIVLRNDANSREGATHFDNANGRYMKGAATGANAGNATDVATHNHTQSHSHTLSHGHGNSGQAYLIDGKLGGGEVDSVIIRDHDHVAYFATHNENVSNSDAVPTQTNDLAYKELHFWKADSLLLPKVGDVAMCTLTTLPIGWSDLGVSDTYIKGKASGQSLSMGGSLTHGHPPLSHGHAGSSHTHTFTTSTATNTAAYRNGGSSNVAGQHSHSGTTDAATNASAGSANITFSTENWEPEYIKVRFIKMDFTVGTGAACIPAII